LNVDTGRGPAKVTRHGVQELTLTTSEQTEIILYTHPDCPFSAQAKMHYRRQRVAYTEIDVSKRPDQVPALLELSGGERVTPIIVENGTVTIGFDGGF
jgi:glutaredoxin